MQVLGARGQKGHKPFHFPARVDLRKYCTKAAINDCWAGCTEYRLVGVLAHTGVADDGHYAYYQQLSANEWWVRNDNEPPRSLNKKTVMSLVTEAVALVYSRMPPPRYSESHLSALFLICMACSTIFSTHAQAPHVSNAQICRELRMLTMPDFVALNFFCTSESDMVRCNACMCSLQLDVVHRPNQCNKHSVQQKPYQMMTTASSISRILCKVVLTLGVCSAVCLRMVGHAPATFRQCQTCRRCLAPTLWTAQRPSERCPLAGSKGMS